MYITCSIKKATNAGIIYCLHYKYFHLKSCKKVSINIFILCIFIRTLNNPVYLNRILNNSVYLYRILERFRIFAPFI